MNDVIFFLFYYEISRKKITFVAVNSKNYRIINF